MAEPSEEFAELRAELRRRDGEILRLRDLLIARDAELGAVRGRLRELEVRHGRFALPARVLRRLSGWR